MVISCNSVACWTEKERKRERVLRKKLFMGDFEVRIDKEKTFYFWLKCLEGRVVIVWSLVFELPDGFILQFRGKIIYPNILI
jgi:hypothetical protein